MRLSKRQEPSLLKALRIGSAGGIVGCYKGDVFDEWAPLQERRVFGAMGKVSRIVTRLLFHSKDAKRIRNIFWRLRVLVIEICNVNKDTPPPPPSTMKAGLPATTPEDVPHQGEVKSRGPWRSLYP
jgi:hypothetical protein